MYKAKTFNGNFNVNSTSADEKFNKWINDHPNIHSMNIYNQLSCVKIDDRLIRSMILINILSEVAMISTEIHGDYHQYKSYMDAVYDEINNTKIPYPKKLTDTIIHKTCAMLGMDIDGDTIDYPKWIAYRDNMIRHNPRVFVQVKWYKTLFKIKCLINKILGGKS